MSAKNSELCIRSMNKELDFCFKVYRGLYANYKNSYNVYQSFKYSLIEPELFKNEETKKKRILNDFLDKYDCSSLPLLTGIQQFILDHLESHILMKNNGLLCDFFTKVYDYELEIKSEFIVFSKYHKQLKKQINVLKAQQTLLQAYIQNQPHAINQEFNSLKSKYFHNFESYKDSSFKEVKVYFNIHETTHLNKMLFLSKKFVKFFSNRTGVAAVGSSNAFINLLSEYTAEILQQNYIVKKLPEAALVESPKSDDIKIDHEKTSFDVYSEMFKRPPLEINSTTQPIPVQTDKVKLNKKLEAFKRESAKIDELLKRKFCDSKEDEANLQIVPEIKQEDVLPEDGPAIPFHNFGMETGDNLYNSWSLPRVVKPRSSKKKSKKVDQPKKNEIDKCATDNLIDFSKDKNDLTSNPMFDDEILYPEAFYTTTSIEETKMNELGDKKESLTWHKETNSYLFRPDSIAAMSMKYFAPDSLQENIVASTVLDQATDSLEHISILIDMKKSDSSLNSPEPIDFSLSNNVFESVSVNLDVDCQLVPKTPINDKIENNLYFFKEQEHGDKNHALSCLIDEQIVLCNSIESVKTPTSLTLISQMHEQAKPLSNPNKVAYNEDFKQLAIINSKLSVKKPIKFEIFIESKCGIKKKPKIQFKPSKSDVTAPPPPPKENDWITILRTIDDDNNELTARFRLLKESKVKNSLPDLNRSYLISIYNSIDDDHHELTARFKSLKNRKDNRSIDVKTLETAKIPEVTELINSNQDELKQIEFLNMLLQNFQQGLTQIESENKNFEQIDPDCDVQNQLTQTLMNNAKQMNHFNSLWNTFNHDLKKLEAEQEEEKCSDRRVSTPIRITSPCTTPVATELSQIECMSEPLSSPNKAPYTDAFRQLAVENSTLKVKKSIKFDIPLRPSGFLKKYSSESTTDIVTGVLATMVNTIVKDLDRQRREPVQIDIYPKRILSS